MRLRLISIVVVTGLLSGCGGLAFLNLGAAPGVATPTVSAAAGGSDLMSYGLPIVGSYEGYNEVFAGNTVRNLQDDSELVTVRLLNTGAICEGRLRAPDDGWPTEWPIATRNCLNRIARGTLTCSDGRELILDWRATQCQVAYGEGFDHNGGTLNFNVLDSAEAAANRVELLTAQLAPYPPLPLVR